MMVRPSCCPLCGHSITELENKIIVDLTSNTVITPMGGVHLPPKEAELAFILVKRMPTFVYHEVLYTYLWGGQEPALPDASLKVYISRLRKLLAPIGIEVENRTGCGYRMVKVWEREKTA